MKVVIDRKKWLHGEGSGDSYLLRESDGKMCCLGFFALACGAAKKNITSAATPEDTYGVKWPETVFTSNQRNNETIFELIIVNDDKDLEEKVREKSIKELFSEIDVKVEFTG